MRYEQKRIDFEWAVIERVTEMLARRGPPKVRLEIARQTWALVAELHRVSCVNAAESGRPAEGCYADSDSLADEVRRRLMSNRELVDQVQRVLAWLAKEGLVWTMRRKHRSSFVGSTFHRFVNFERCRTFLDELSTAESTPNSGSTTSASQPDHLRTTGGPPPHGAPTTSAPRAYHLRTSAETRTSEDSKDPHTQASSRGGAGVLFLTTQRPNGRRRSRIVLTPPPNAEELAWAPVRKLLHDREVSLKNELIDHFIAIGFRPKYVSETIKQSSKREGGLYLQLADLRRADFDDWVSHTSSQIHEWGKAHSKSPEEVRAKLKQWGCLNDEPARPAP